MNVRMGIRCKGLEDQNISKIIFPFWNHAMKSKIKTISSLMGTILCGKTLSLINFLIGALILQMKLMFKRIERKMWRFGIWSDRICATITIRHLKKLTFYLKKQLMSLRLYWISKKFIMLLCSMIVDQWVEQNGNIWWMQLKYSSINC